jgi:hypothetical protein
MNHTELLLISRNKKEFCMEIKEKTTPEQQEQNDYSFLPPKAWFTLKEACELKNLSYKTACNDTTLQPNYGLPDSTLGKKKYFKRQTIIDWLYKPFN